MFKCDSQYNNVLTSTCQSPFDFEFNSFHSCGNFRFWKLNTCLEWFSNVHSLHWPAGGDSWLQKDVWLIRILWEKNDPSCHFMYYLVKMVTLTFWCSLLRLLSCAILILKAIVPFWVKWNKALVCFRAGLPRDWQVATAARAVCGITTSPTHSPKMIIFCTWCWPNAWRCDYVRFPRTLCSDRNQNKLNWEWRGNLKRPLEANKRPLGFGPCKKQHGHNHLTIGMRCCVCSLRVCCSFLRVTRPSTWPARCTARCSSTCSPTSNRSGLAPTRAACGSSTVTG